MVNHALSNACRVISVNKIIRKVRVLVNVCCSNLKPTSRQAEMSVTI